MNHLCCGKGLCFSYIYYFNVLYCVYLSGRQSSIRSLPCICSCFEWFSWSLAWFGQSGNLLFGFPFLSVFCLSDIKFSFVRLSVQKSYVVVNFTHTYIFNIFSNTSALLLYCVVYFSQFICTYVYVWFCSLLLWCYRKFSDGSGQ